MSRPSPPSPYPAPGEIIDGAWRIEKILGEGGMGAVALAWDLFLHTPVAIKFMNPQFLTFPGAEQRFLNEGRASALIKSDHVVPVTKAGKTATGMPFLVMEALEGHDLADVIAHEGAPGLPIERAVHFVLQVLRALQAAHAIGIIHRDMKPSNCFVVVKDGETDFVKILDFGISKVQQPGSASLTQTNSALGTPLYMSPEQARSPRDVDARSDLYSVGVILYELLTGHTPFFSESGEFTEILFKLFTAEAPPVQSTRPDVSDGLAAAVHKALAREVNARYGSALEMAEALAPWASERSKNLLTRMRAFKAPLKGSGSIAPPEDLPESMVAFSQIGASTGVMPNRPTTDVMKSAPITKLLAVPERAPPVAGAAVDGGSPALVATPRAADGGTPAHSTTSRVVDAGAFPEEAAVARTQYDRGVGNVAAVRPERERVAAASTDLGATRDTSFTETAEKRRSPLIFALPVIALIGIVGAVIGFSKGDRDHGLVTAPPSAIITLPVASSSMTDITPPPPPSIARVESDRPTAPSASVSAAHTPPRTPPRVASPPRPSATGTSVLDTTIKTN